jgi:hypothetical protein
MMNERLRAVVERVEHLPEAEQEALAKLLEEELEEREWEAFTQRLGACAFHDQLRAELHDAETKERI